MKNIFKITIADNSTFFIFIVISLLFNTFFVSSPINISIKLVSKILRCDINVENNSRILAYNAEPINCIIKKDKTNNSDQKNMFLDVFLNSFNKNFKSENFKNYINYEYKYNSNIIELFNILKMDYAFKLMLIFLIIMLFLPRRNSIFIKIINKNISRS
jgi:hypothetical protein